VIVEKNWIMTTNNISQSSHHNEDVCINEFLSLRLINIDTAYNTLLHTVVAEVRKGDQSIYDVDYVLQQIKSKTELLSSPVYFNPNFVNNPVQQLPVIITDEKRGEDERESTRKALEFYQKLKEHTGDISLLPQEENIPDGDLVHMRNILKNLESKRDIPRRMIINHCFLLGKVLLAIKNKAKSSTLFLEHAKHDVGFSKSYSYFLIHFSRFCMEYPKLKTVSISITSIRKHFVSIRSFVENDGAYWKL
jgi:hypothetical protein